jgi:hypothetical protein
MGPSTINWFPLEPVYGGAWWPGANPAIEGLRVLSGERASALTAGDPEDLHRPGVRGADVSWIADTIGGGLRQGRWHIPEQKIGGCCAWILRSIAWRLKALGSLPPSHFTFQPT